VKDCLLLMDLYCNEIRLGVGRAEKGEASLSFRFGRGLKDTAKTRLA